MFNLSNYNCVSEIRYYSNVNTFLLVGDLNSSLMYLASYIVASFAFFSILLNLKINNKEITYISDLRFLSSSQLERSLLVVSLSSIAGLPPFSGFYGKMMIWSSLIEDIYLYGDIFSSFIFILNLAVSLIVIFYYIRLILILFIGDEQNLLSSLITVSNSSRATSLELRSVQLLLLSVIVLWTFLVPILLENITLFSEAVSKF